MSDIDDKILITINIRIVGNSKENDWPSEWEYCSTTEEISLIMKDLADACEDGRVFGWMMKEIAEAQLAAGEWVDGDEADGSGPPYVTSVRRPLRDEGGNP